MLAQRPGLVQNPRNCDSLGVHQTVTFEKSISATIKHFVKRHQSRRVEIRRIFSYGASVYQATSAYFDLKKMLWCHLFQDLSSVAVFPNAQNHRSRPYENTNVGRISIC